MAYGHGYQYHSPLEDSYQDETGSNDYKYSPYYERYYRGGKGSSHSYRENYQQGDSSQQGYSSDYPLPNTRNDNNQRNPRGSGRGSGPSTSGSSRPTYMDQFRGPSYPGELTCLFGAMECRLCGIEVTAPIVAKMHYSGKQHAKKVKNFLEEWCNRTGNPMPEITGTLSSTAGGNTSEYCDLCDVKMLTLSDKLLHMAGKQHRKNVADPANAKKRKREIEYVEMDDRFGIGTEFLPPEILEEREAKLAKVAKIPVQGVFVCELCDVKAVSQDQLDAHLNGKKHKEKVNKKDSTVPKPVHPTMSILASVAKDNRRNKTDYSMHRTPSEYAKNFNCSRCDIWFENRHQLQMHLKGKRHLKTMLKIECEGYEKCDICDVKFTSFDQYQAHIVGKKHKKECEKGLKGAIVFKQEKTNIACKLCPYVGARIDDHYCDQSLLKREKYLMDTKLKCEPCGEVFGSEYQMDEHKKTRRHMLCLLNKEGGDRIIPEYEHWYCIVCKVQEKSQKDYLEHFFTEKHLSLEKEHKSLESKTDLFHCTICDLIIDQEAKDEHMADKSHRREVLKKYSIDLISDLANADDRAMYYNCQDCPECGTMNFLEYNSHLLCLNHLDRIIEQSGQPC